MKISLREDFLKVISEHKGDVDVDILVGASALDVFAQSSQSLSQVEAMQQTIAFLALAMKVETD
jgi:hypothetical protein